MPYLDQTALMKQFSANPGGQPQTTPDGALSPDQPSSAGQAIAAGAANAVPGAKQVVAGVEALGRKALPESLGGAPSGMPLSEIYNYLRSTQEGQIDQSKQDNPKTYYGTQIAVSAPLYATGAGEGEAAAGALSKAADLGPLAQKILATTGRAAGQAGVGAGEAANQGQDPATGAAIGAIGSGAGDLLGAAGNALMGPAYRSALARLAADRYTGLAEDASSAAGEANGRLPPQLQGQRQNLKDMAERATQAASDALAAGGKGTTDAVSDWIKTHGLTAVTGAVLGSQASHPVIGALLGGVAPDVASAAAKGAIGMATKVPPGLISGAPVAGSSVFNSAWQSLQDSPEQSFIDKQSSPEARAEADDDHPFNK